MYNTPILFLVFNRFETTQRVFEQIKKQKPKYLFIAQDGPRENKKEDKQKCEKVRSLFNEIDWDCEVKTLFQEKNLGCKYAVSSAISWFFENVEMGVILEDDCLPNDDFFSFCEQLLIRYKDEEKIKIISGENLQNGIQRGDASYYFSKYPHIWGWATWRRTWKEYDFLLETIDTKKFIKILNKTFNSFWERMVWLDKFILQKNNLINSWDYQLCFSIWAKDGVNILPNKNLVENIGLSLEATHTKKLNQELFFIPTHTILPLVFNDKIEINKKADEYTFRLIYKKNIFQLVYRAIRFCFLKIIK
ncbi:MAG: nucleotide-diphospho-sugar transferase [Bacteroidales bacterium]|jgi:hypothetical protein|nr:nucleotide-diphospho-sugar transferase [Bacteroidales bacterium]